MLTAYPHLLQIISHLAADGWYAKKKYVDALVAEGLQAVTKADLKNHDSSRKKCSKSSHLQEHHDFFLRADGFSAS
jgi:hypothetical protein